MQGNPINILWGNKYQKEVDYLGGGFFPLQVSRSYNSISGDWSFIPKLVPDGVYAGPVLVRADGKKLKFSGSSGFWKADPDVTGYLENSTDGAGSTTGWQYTMLNGQVESYDADGKLISISNRVGITHTYSYSATMITVAHSKGGTLVYQLDSDGQISGFTDPDSNQYTYGYDTEGRLTSVAYPNSGGTRAYHYENTGFPKALTGITDESGIRFATWAYDSEGRAISSEHHGSTEKVTLDYTHIDDASDPRVVSTNALGKQTTYHLTTIHGVRKITLVEGHQSTHCAAANKAYSYDDNGFLASKTDWLGRLTRYTYNDKGQLLSRTEAAGTPEQYITNTDWHSIFNLPVSVKEPYLKTSLAYDTNGNLISKQMLETSNNVNEVVKHTASMTIADADCQSTAGWTVEAGAVRLWRYVGGGYSVAHDDLAIGGDTVQQDFRISQRIDVLAEGVPVAEVDAGDVTAKLSWWHRSWKISPKNDPSRVWFRFLDSSQTLISETVPGFSMAPEIVTQTSIRDVLPANTRYIEIVIEGQYLAGSSVSYWVDDFEGVFEWYGE